jgi:hypothetical protein
MDQQIEHVELDSNDLEVRGVARGGPVSSKRLARINRTLRTFEYSCDGRTATAKVCVSATEVRTGSIAIWGSGTILPSGTLSVSKEASQKMIAKSILASSLPPDLQLSILAGADALPAHLGGQQYDFSRQFIHSPPNDVSFQQCRL